MTTLVYPSKDASTLEVTPTTNYPNNIDLYVNGLSTIGDKRHTFMDFDYSALDKYTFVSAELSLKPYSSSSSHNVGYSPIISTWTETGITWNNEPSYSVLPSNELSISGITENRTDEDITSYVNGIISDGNSHYGLAFITTEIVSGSDQFTKFYSGEASVSLRPYTEVTTHADEGYDVSKNISASLLGVYTYGNGRCDMNDYNVGNNTAYCSFRLPWSDTWESYKTYAVNDFDSYTNIETGYTEYFTTKFTGLFFDGEIYNAVFDIHWYRDYGDTYVTTSGNDSNTGTSWSNPFRTVTKGFDSVSIDRTVNVEGGTYAGESSFDVKRDCSMILRSGYGDVTLNIN